MEQNLKRYGWYVALRDTYLWMPIFFLYFQSLLSIEQVLLLEALYYACVVIMEVPSGYASDRLGRKPVLVLSSLAFAGGYLAFCFGAVPGLIVGQVMLAVAISLNSGTDTSFHYDTLLSMGKEDEYGEREAVLGRVSAWSQSLGALIGGALACWHLHWPYIGSALTACAMVAIALSFRTPKAQETTRSFRQQLRACWRLVRTRPLAWLFVVAVLAIMLNHVPYEFYQTYIQHSLKWGAVAQWSAQGGEWAPLIAGVHVTLVWLVSGWFARRSVGWAERLGYVPILIASLCVQLALVWLMALALHPMVAILLLGRGIAGGLQKAPIRALLGPRVDPDIRATYLSLQSLTGRLGYALLLVVLSMVHATTGARHVFQSKITVAAMILSVAVLLVVISVRFGADTKTPSQTL